MVRLAVNEALEASSVLTRSPWGRILPPLCSLCGGEKSWVPPQHHIKNFAHFDRQRETANRFHRNESVPTGTVVYFLAQWASLCFFQILPFQVQHRLTLIEAASLLSLQPVSLTTSSLLSPSSFHLLFPPLICVIRTNFRTTKSDAKCDVLNQALFLLFQIADLHEWVEYTRFLRHSIFWCFLRLVFCSKQVLT